MHPHPIITPPPYHHTSQPPPNHLPTIKTPVILVHTGWRWNPFYAQYVYFFAPKAGIDGSNATCLSVTQGGGINLGMPNGTDVDYQPFANARTLSLWITPNAPPPPPGVPAQPPIIGLPIKVGVVWCEVVCEVVVWGVVGHVVIVWYTQEMVYQCTTSYSSISNNNSSSSSSHMMIHTRHYTPLTPPHSWDCTMLQQTVFVMDPLNSPPPLLLHESPMGTCSTASPWMNFDVLV